MRRNMRGNVAERQTSNATSRLTRTSRIISVSTRLHYTIGRQKNRYFFWCSRTDPNFGKWYFCLVHLNCNTREVVIFMFVTASRCSYEGAQVHRGPIVRGVRLPSQGPGSCGRLLLATQSVEGAATKVLPGHPAQSVKWMATRVLPEIPYQQSS